MKSYRFAALLALSLTASLAHAARDEVLIQQARKNQLAHEAQAGKADQATAGHSAQDRNAATVPQRRHG